MKISFVPQRGGGWTANLRTDKGAFITGGETKEEAAGKLLLNYPDLFGDVEFDTIPWEAWIA